MSLSKTLFSKTTMLLENDFYSEKGVHKTPLLHAVELSKLLGCQLYLKCENLQNTGSFKIRGATSAISRLSPTQKMAGVVTASSGNHGVGTALAGQSLGVPVHIYVPESVSAIKADKIIAMGASLHKVSGGTENAERKAQEVAAQSPLTYISPYNHIDVIAGQGTIAHEIVDELPQLDSLLVSVGGGGLISGIAANMRHLNPTTEIVGIWAEHSPVMLTCIKAGKIIQVPELPTLSDGTAGGLDDDAITLPLCQALINQTRLVSEMDIANAMELVKHHHGFTVEGAAGAALACAIKYSDSFVGKTIVVVLCGANITDKKFAAAMNMLGDNDGTI